MLTPANFRIDPRLASILGSGYRTSDHALKELVDNAWDADAEEIYITLSEPLSGQPIMVADHGAGMTEAEVRSYYLSVATDRRTKRGTRSPRLNRQIKGRKGIGKFAGIMLADRMTIETTARGVTTKLVINKDDLLRASEEQDDSDLETINLPLEVFDAPDSRTGTIITLDLFNQRLSLPTPERLRQLLMLEYGVSERFRIYVNGRMLELRDISGQMFELTEDLEDVGRVAIRTKIAEDQKPLKDSGIIFRVEGKVVGTPSWYGLQDDEEVPYKLLKRVRVEIDAEGLKDVVTADWGAVVESSRGVQAAIKKAHLEVKAKLVEVHANEMQLAKARLKQKIDKGLERLPEYRRDYAGRALDRILRHFYQDKLERQEAVVSVVLDAFEKDDYWQVVQAINDARDRDVEDFAAALAQFGLLELARVGQQAHQRLKFLDDVQLLIENSNTLEKTLHTALERNLWIFGPQFEPVASNRHTQGIIESYFKSKYSGDRAAKRPDLLLAAGSPDHLTLLEFKRPSHTIDRDDESQGQQYRDDIKIYAPNAKIELLIVGGQVKKGIALDHLPPLTTYTTYHEILHRGRVHMKWLLDNLTT